MDLMSKVTISASMLLTGFTIVFAVLIFLILIIWFYGKIISTAQKKSDEKKAVKAAKEVEDKSKQPNKDNSEAQTSAPVVNSAGTSEEIAAVISAAVYSMYGSAEKVKIKSIKKSSGRSAWANAGVLNNTRPF